MQRFIFFISIAVVIIIIGSIALVWGRSEFPLPEGETHTVSNNTSNDNPSAARDENTPSTSHTNENIMVTDDTKHSIPLDEILSGGPGKDGIPSIDNPIFISPEEADKFLEPNSVGIGLEINDEARFYPYDILVWHEIVNDTVGGRPVAVTYCPLCGTGIVFDRTVENATVEFGVSGKLYESNLLMYDRRAHEENESLWSQVLGEAVVGPRTGTKLEIVRSDAVQYSKWKDAHPDTRVLSQDTGAVRSYGSDPYGNYYTSDRVSFGATFNDDRLHPKEIVLGIELNEAFKAYHKAALPVGTTTDTFADRAITITRTTNNEITFTADGEAIPTIEGFWFSWLAVHPETKLYK